MIVDVPLEEVLAYDHRLKRSLRRPGKRWVACVVEAWPENRTNGKLSWLEKRRVRKRAKQLYQERYGNPMLYFFVLEIIIKAVMWWLQNRKS